MSLIEEILALDVLTLREHTQQAGDAFDLERQRASLTKLLEVSELCEVRRDGALVAYSMLQRRADASAFVTGFNTHPLHRNSVTMRALISAFAERVNRLGINALYSHVYKTNRLSMAFHQRLGFRVTRENDKGVEFFATVAELNLSPSLARTFHRVGADHRPSPAALPHPSTEIAHGH